jgi:hypothetical protein
MVSESSTNKIFFDGIMLPPFRSYSLTLEGSSKGDICARDNLGAVPSQSTGSKTFAIRNEAMFDRLAAKKGQRTSPVHKFVQRISAP